MGLSTSHHGILILSALTDGDRHGYAIKKEVERRTGGDVRMGSTSLYRVLGQLLDAGLIAERPGGQDDDPRRRYYRITPSGRRELAAELARLQRVLTAARAGRRA